MWRKIVRTKPGTFNEQFCSFSCKEHEWKHKVKVLVISMVISIVRKPLLIGRPLPTKQFLLTENDDERCPPERQHLQLPILNTMTTSHFLAYPAQYTDVASTKQFNLCMISACQWLARWWGHHSNCLFSFQNCSSANFYFTDIDGIVYIFYVIVFLKTRHHGHNLSLFWLRFSLSFAEHKLSVDGNLSSEGTGV